MPYIPQENRKALDARIDALAQEIVTESKKYNEDSAFAGLLNYSCTRLALKVVKLRFGNIRYWILATLTGVFKNIGDELYRRIGSAYEDKKIEENGDVDLYEEFLNHP